MNHRAVFEAVGNMLDRDLSASETEELTAAIAAACQSLPEELTTPGARIVSTVGVELIQRFEGCARKLPDGRFAAYPDPGTGGAPWTIGWGATGPNIGPGTVWSQTQCDTRLIEDIARHASDVDRVLGDAATKQAQFDALASFHYNTGAIGRATLTKRHKAGRLEDARNEFPRWNRAGGRVLKGLVRRRAAEAELYEQ